MISLLQLTPLTWLLVVSLLINLAGFCALARVIHGRGGLSYLKSLVLRDNEATVDPASRARREILASLPTPSFRPIVFLGDSLTAGYDWAEAFPVASPVLNRGLGGDTTLGVLHRLPDIGRLNPRAVFLMIGTNDAQMLALAPADTITYIRKIIANLLANTPDATIYLQSILPSRTPKFNTWSEQVNRTLETLADGRQIHYRNIRPHFLDADNRLDRRFTYDGLHLTAEGYTLWRTLLQPTLQTLHQAKSQAASV